MTNFAIKQAIQEKEYDLPVNYNIVFSDEQRLLWQISRISRMEVVADLLKPFRGQNILDAGCGDGLFCYFFSKENVRLTGIDFSKRAITFAKSFNPNANFILGDITSLPTSKKYDQIILQETLEHIVPEKITKTLSGLARLLTANGKLIITVPSINLPLHPKHYQHFTEETLKKTLLSHFSDISIIGYANCNWKRNIFEWLRIFAFILYPAHNKVKIVDKFYQFIKFYYDTQLAVGVPKICQGIIAICQKPIYQVKPI